MPAKIGPFRNTLGSWVRGRVFAIVSLAAAAAFLVPPLGAGLVYTCAANVDATQAGTCAALNGATVAGQYNSVFSDVNADIYIQFGNTGVGSSSFNVTPVSYAQYTAARPGSPLPATDPLISYGNTSGNIDVTAALASALGLSTNGANTAGVETDGTTSCTLGGAGCYNGVITITDGGGFSYPLSESDPTSGTTYDFFYVVEHETDEVLGTISCIGTIDGVPADQCNATDASPGDLFRYSAPGVPSFLTTADGSPAYFSTDGGVTPIVYYSNAPGLGDYGDWAWVGIHRVQNGEASPGVTLDITDDGGSEIALLNAVGFGLAAPEPGTIAQMGAGMIALTLVRILRRRMC